MIARLHRFHGHRSLRGVYARGQTVRGSLVSLKFAQRDPKFPFRMAVVVSRKVHKSAVVRNRIRRRIYEINRRKAEQISSGTDLVYTVYGSDVATMESSALEAQIAELLDKARIKA
jgi:ribonuclease P protein component